MDKEIEKLKRLLKHWKEHSSSHKDSYIKWKNVAKERGFVAVVQNLNKAIEKLDESTSYLDKAYEFLNYNTLKDPDS
ncbi:MAG: hypothetical protein KGD63_06780 [Candidatus Lokiarchaeota archaeon]|nr:hypothetical protein [Candidatus Lokiarchaeota archaeon]